MKTLITTVADASIKTEAQARAAFWDRMETANGGREGDPRDYISIIEPVVRDARGFVFRYEVPAELLEQNAVSVIREDYEPLEIPLNVKRSEPVYIEPPEGRVAHADKLMRSVDVLVAKHKQTVEHFNPAPNCQNVLKPANLAEPVPTQAEPVFESMDGEQRPIPVKDVMITGWNPRKAFDAEALQALAEDIRQNELINAITVRPKGKRYELVAGERRLRAFRLLGRATIPAKVRELTDEQMLDVMLAENLQRVDLNPIEEAHHLKRVLEVGKLTQTELGRRVGKSQEWVSQRLRLAEAPAVLQDLIIRRQINTSSAIEVLQWKNTEHYDAIMHEIGAWSVEGEELPRARVREIIKEITEPVAERPPQEQGPSLGTINGTDNGDLPFVNPEDCKDCDIYDRATNTCPEGCTCDSECEDCFCEVTDDEEGGCEMFGVPGAADDEVCAVDCPDYEECKNEAAEKEEDDQDLPDEPEPVADPADMAVGLKRNAMILELAKNRPMNCTCERDPWDNGVRTFECRICHEVFIDQKGMEAFVMVRHLIGDGYHSDHRDAAQAVLAKAHLQPIKEALQRYFVGGSEVEDDVRIREQEADVAVNDFDRQSGFGGPSYMEEQCRAGNKDAIEARKARNKLTEARLNIRKEAEARGVRL